MNVEELRAALRTGPMSGLYRMAAQQRRLIQDWAATHIFTGLRIADTPFGFKLAAGHYHANRKMQAGTFEPDEVALIKSYLDGCDIFVDAGANIGFYTCLAAHAGKPVLAFEPQPRNLATIYENIRINQFKSVDVFPIALGAESGIADLYGSSGPSASLLKGWDGASSGFKQTVSVNTMDALIASRLKGKRAFIKVDVEGFEYNLLRGAKEIMHLDPKPTWLIEVCLNEAHPGGSNRDYEKTLNLFFDAGYRVFPATAQDQPVSREDVARFQRENKTPFDTFDYVIRA